MNRLHQEKLVLASQSPRRKELLEQMGLELIVSPAHVDETNGNDLKPQAFVDMLSRVKTRAVMTAYPDAWVIGADTVVVADEQILGKPDSLDEAVQMLKKLSGREHSVFTGFTVGHLKKNYHKTIVVETQVRFKPLSEDEIRWYAETPEPYDKAGGYGIQGMGGFMVESIQGSYSNVVGLPLCEVMETLVDQGAVRF